MLTEQITIAAVGIRCIHTYNIMRVFFIDTLASLIALYSEYLLSYRSLFNFVLRIFAFNSFVFGSQCIQQQQKIVFFL